MTPNSAPEVYRAASVSDLFNALPMMFGFTVTESLVVVITTGPRRRLGVRLRIDLTEPEHSVAMADRVARHVGEHRGDGVVILAVSDDAQRAERAVRLVAARVDVPVVEAAWATADRCWRLDDPDADGSPHAADPAHESIVRAVAAGQVIVNGRDELAGEIAASARAESAEILEHLGHLVDGMDPAPSRDQLRRRVALGRRVVADLAAGRSVDERQVVTIAFWCRTHEVRDAWWFDIDQVKAAEQHRAWAHVARSVPAVVRVPALVLAGFAAWQLGDGARALVAAEAAQALHPGHSFPQTLLAVLDRGLHPDAWSDVKRRFREVSGAESP